MLGNVGFYLIGQGFAAAAFPDQLDSLSAELVDPFEQVEGGV